jgi:hypothetical protein
MNWKLQIVAIWFGHPVLACLATWLFCKIANRLTSPPPQEEPKP